jgi:hypothetical protein
VTGRPSPLLWSGLAGLGSIGGVFFAVSLDHAHQLFVDNGQGGWVAGALAAVVVLLAVGSTVELARRVVMKEPIAPVAAALLLGIAIEGWGNLATVDDEHANPPGYFLAGLPTVGTLILLWVFESARLAARRRRTAAEEEKAREEAARVASERQRRAAAEAQERTRAEAQRAAQERAQAEAQEAQRIAAEEAQAEAQRRAQEEAQRAEAGRLRREQEEEERRSKLPPPPAPGTEAHAIELALSHRLEHGELPGPTELSRLSETSLATAKRALKKIRETPALHLVHTA